MCLLGDHTSTTIKSTCHIFPNLLWSCTCYESFLSLMQFSQPKLIKGVPVHYPSSFDNINKIVDMSYCHIAKLKDIWSSNKITKTQWTYWGTGIEEEATTKDHMEQCVHCKSFASLTWGSRSARPTSLWSTHRLQSPLRFLIIEAVDRYMMIQIPSGLIMSTILLLLWAGAPQKTKTLYALFL